jgi:hypothetical protein
MGQYDLGRLFWQWPKILEFLGEEVRFKQAISFRYPRTTARDAVQNVIEQNLNVKNRASTIYASSTM